MTSLSQRQIIAFFQCAGTDDDDRTLEQIIRWDDQLWNCCHNHIQWVLPTDEQSRFNEDAPILDETLQQIFKADRSLQLNLRRGLQRFMSFLGLSLEGDFDSGDRLQVVKASNFNKRILTCWRGPQNHNWKRLSRALRCLGLVGMVMEQKALFACLLEIVHENPGMIDGSTVDIWKERAGADGDVMSDATGEDLDLDATSTDIPRKRRRASTMSSSVPGGSLQSLRAYFASVDTDASGGVSQEELRGHVKSIIEQRQGTFSQELSELFEEAVKRCFHEIDVRSAGSLDVNEWVHFVMMHGSAPCPSAAQNLNRRLRTALIKDPDLLARLLAAFEAQDIEGNAKLPPNCWQQALEAAGAKLAPTADLDQDGFLDYFEFVSHSLGVWPAKVELAVYDLAPKLAKWLPPSLLSGEQLEGGAWHTGVRVFETEFWFGGNIFPSKLSDGETPFGCPVRVEMLGLTQRAANELVDFIQNELVPTFNQSSYDSVRRNGNHFCNEVMQFLLNGRQLPQELLATPQWAQNDALLQRLRPTLNSQLRNLGSLGAKGAFASLPLNDDHLLNWRGRLQAGDMVLHRRRFSDCPQVARVTSLRSAKAGQRVAELLTFGSAPMESLDQDGPAWSFVVELWEWAPVQLSGVELGELWPCVNQAALGRTVLQSCLAPQN